MLAGMYVTHAGATHQVRRIIGNTPSYSTQWEPGTLYELQPLDGGHLVYLRAPKAVDIPLTPACGDCDKPAGFCAGHVASAQQRTA